MTSFHLRWRDRRPGMSLLEVMLAIAILGMSLVILAELVRMGSRCSREAREITVAQLLCEAKMAEVTLGFASTQSASQQPCETNPNWMYSINAQQADETGLMLVMVQVTEAQPAGRRPLEFTLTRLMVDPNLEAAISASTTDSSSNATSSGTSSSGTSGASSPSGGSSTSGS